MKVRDLQKLLKQKLEPTLINTIFRYLERSKLIEVDLDGNIIWIKKKSELDNNLINEGISFADKANKDQNFREYVKKLGYTNF